MNIKDSDANMGLWPRPHNVLIHVLSGPVTGPGQYEGSFIKTSLILSIAYIP